MGEINTAFSQIEACYLKLNSASEKELLRFLENAIGFLWALDDRNYVEVLKLVGMNEGKIREKIKTLLFVETWLVNRGIRPFEGLQVDALSALFLFMKSKGDYYYGGSVEKYVSEWVSKCLGDGSLQEFNETELSTSMISLSKFLCKDACKINTEAVRLLYLRCLRPSDLPISAPQPLKIWLLATSIYVLGPLLDQSCVYTAFPVA